MGLKYIGIRILTFLGHDVTWQGPPVQNLTPYFDFPPHIAIQYDTLGGSKEDLRLYTGETANAKAKPSENFQVQTQIGQIWVVLGVWN